MPTLCKELVLLGIKKGKIEIAKSMLQEGDTVEKIVPVTGLSVKQLEQLISAN